MSVQIIQDHIPKGRRNRPGYKMDPKYITIHDTANTQTGADAAAHARYVKNTPNLLASWHFTVDDKIIYQHLPLNENGWHGGDGVNGAGNRQSIGIEICENRNGDRKKAEANAAWLTAKLLVDFNLPIAAVKQHYNWSGKNCPRVLRARVGGWAGFWAAVQSNLLPAIKTPILGAPQATVAQAQAWAKVSGAHQRFIDIAPLYWQYGALTGIRPEVLYAQSAHETGFGRYGGAITPDQNNWAGIKIKNPTADRREDHESFATPEDGVRAHINHMCAYVGKEPVGAPIHYRYYVVKGLSWAGSVKTVEELGGKWAPRAGYGQSITGLINALLATKAPDEPAPQLPVPGPDLPSIARRIGIMVNGRTMDTPGYLINNVTYVPASAIIEVAKGQVTGHGDHIRIVI